MVSAAIEFKAEGRVLGTGAKMFTIAGPVLVWGTSASVLVGIVYLCETLSVILQVTYFKLTHGKRIFKMSPIHHHFEMCGWKERKICVVFTLVQLFGGIIGTALLYYGMK